MKETGKTIQSVQRAIDIINCFNEANIELTLTQISGMVGLKVTTAHGLLGTLAANGFIRQNSSGKYMLGQSLLDKSRFAQSAARVAMMDVARPVMSRLAAKYKMTMNLVILEGWRLYYLQQELPPEAIYIVHHVSEQDPMYCTASGKLTLAHMPRPMLEEYLEKTPLRPVSVFTITAREALLENLGQIRRQGYAYEKEELGEGISAVAAPLYSPSGELYGAISAVGVAYTLERFEKALAADLIEANRQIAGELFA